MNSKEYIDELNELLWMMSDSDRKEAVSFYEESIADRMDDGATEEQAVESLPSPKESARSILQGKLEADSDESEVDIYRSALEEIDESDAELPRESFRMRLKQRKFSVGEWVAIILTSVIWIPLLLSALSVVLGLVICVAALFICAWVVVGCVWITGAALVLTAPATLLFDIWGVQVENLPYLLVNIGYGLFAFGSGMWVLLGALKLSKGFYAWQKRHLKIIVEKKDGTVKQIGGSKSGSNASAVEDSAVAENCAVVESPERSGRKIFFRICTILLFVGLAFVAAGFLASGFDWHVFSNMVISNGQLYIGGTPVKDPSSLLFLGMFF